MRMVILELERTIMKQGPTTLQKVEEKGREKMFPEGEGSLS